MQLPKQNIPSLCYLLIIWIMAPALLAAQVKEIPVVHISTENEVTITSKDAYVHGDLTIESSDTALALTQVPMRIRGRGNSTWGLPKKPYKIKLDYEHKLLGMKANNRDWVLLANYCDKSLMRNGLAFEIGKFTGMDFVPDYRFVDLFINGEFMGNYLLTDQIEVANHRVSVEKQTNETVAAGDISGGYLLEIDGFADREPVRFSTHQGLKVAVKYPDDEDIHPTQLSYIRSFMLQYEDVLFSPFFHDPKSGYRALTDTASLINWYIASELSGNSDAFWSTYLYKFRNNNQLFYGPMWDYDIAFNNDWRLGDATRKLMADYGHAYKQWINRLWQDEWFVNAVAHRWQQLEAMGIHTHLQHYIDETETLLHASQQRNFERWDILGKRVYLEQELFPSYEDAVSFLRTYIHRRTDYLHAAFALSGSTFEPENRYYSFHNKHTAKAIEPLNGASGHKTPLVIWETDEQRLQQQWKFERVSDSTYRIINRLTQKSMMGMGHNTEVVQSIKNAANTAQQWKMEPLGAGGLFALINVKSGLAVDNRGGSFANGNPVIEWDNASSNNENQQWELVPGEYYLPTSTPEIEQPMVMRVHPSVSNNWFTVHLNIPFSGPNRLHVYTVVGQQKAALTLPDYPLNNTTYSFSAQHLQLNKGVYVLKLVNSNGVVAIGKIVVK